MSINLLHDSHSEYFEYLDWTALTAPLKSALYFEKNRAHSFFECLLDSPEELDRYYDTLSRLRDNQEGWLASKNSYEVLFSPEFDDQEFLISLKKGREVGLADLNPLALGLEYHSSLKALLKNHDLLSSRFSIDPDVIQFLVRKFLNPYRQVVDQNGSVNFDRHPVLRSLHQKLIQLDQSIRHSMIELQRDPMYQESLQHEGHDVLFDRYVLAIRSDSYQAKLGHIVSRSKSGQTLYVEPTSVHRICNERMQMMAKMEEEMAKIYRELISGIAEQLDCFFIVFDLILYMDRMAARIHYINLYDLNRPKVLKTFRIHLEGFAHPLIPGAVTNDLTIEAHERGMIISGPNTGGKTVVLKTLAVTHLFMRMGLFVPAKKAELYPLKGLYYFSSDHQDLSENLSSFSSESAYYLDLVDHVEDGAMILIDEIFNSTSSEEASALAFGMVEQLETKNIKLCISTHHHFFKTLMHAKKNFLSAHVGFDREAQMPTYKLYTGTPGSSMAISIFKKLVKTRSEFCHAMVQIANRVLDHKHRTYEELLEEVATKNGELSKILEENRALNYELKNQKRAMEGTLLLEKQKLLKQFKEKVQKEFRKAQNLVHDFKSERKRFQKRLAETESSVNRAMAVEEEIYISKESGVKGSSVTFDEVVIGSQYYITTLAKYGVAESLLPKKSSVVMLVKKMKVTVPVKNLLASGQSEKRSPEFNVRVEQSQSAQLEIDGRGLRLEAFQQLVDQHIGHLYQSHIPYLDVIHGHGTGVLKRWLREFVKKDPVLSLDDSLENDGMSRIILRSDRSC